MNADLLVLAAAALSGLMGSAHCAAMCGGIATRFPVQPGRAGWLDALEPNVGRVIGYVLAGALAGGIGQGIAAALPTTGLERVLRAAVGLVLVVAAIRLWDTRGRLRFLELPGRMWIQWLAPLRQRLLPANPSARRMVGGIFWGWLPCGLSTTVLAAAWLQGNAWQGAMTMLAFGAGTLPAMVPLTWSGARTGHWLRQRGPRSLAAAFVLLAGLATLAGPWVHHLPAVHSALAALGCRSLT